MNPRPLDLKQTIENFFDDWFYPVKSKHFHGQFDYPHRHRLYTLLLDKKIQADIILKEEELKKAPRGSHPDNGYDKFYINRIFLTAILTSPDQWSQSLISCLEAVIQYVVNQVNYISQDLVKQMKYFLQEIRPEKKSELRLSRPTFMLLMPLQAKTLQDWFAIRDYQLTEEEFETVYEIVRGSLDSQRRAILFYLCISDKFNSLLKKIIQDMKEKNESLNFDEVGSSTAVMFSPESFAAHQNNYGAFRLLIENKANIFNSNLNTTLYSAAKNNWPDVVKLPAENKLEISEFQIKPMIEAALEGNSDKALEVIITHYLKAGQPQAWGGLLKKAQNVACLKLLIQAGFDLQEKYRELIEGAVQKSDVEMLSYLVEEQKIELSWDRSKNSPLAMAIFLNQKPVIKYLLSSRLNTVEREASALAIQAIKNGDAEVVELLLDHKVDFTKPYEGNFPVHVAAADGKVDVLALLAKKDVNLNQLATEGRFRGTVAAILAEKHDAKKLDKLKDYLDFTFVNGAGENLLFYVLKNPSGLDVAERVDLLVKKGVNVNARAANGYSSALHAVWHNDLASLKILVENKADIKNPYQLSDRTKLQNFTLAHYAAFYGFSEILLYLIKQGIDIHHPAQHGVTAVNWAAINRQSDILQILADHGADLDAPCSDDQLRPSHNAVLNQDIILLRILAKHHVNFNRAIQDRYQYTPLDYAFRDHFSEGVELLLEHHARLNFGGHPKFIIQFLLKEKPDAQFPYFEKALSQSFDAFVDAVIAFIKEQNLGFQQTLLAQIKDKKHLLGKLLDKPNVLRRIQASVMTEAATNPLIKAHVFAPAEEIKLSYGKLPQMLSSIYNGQIPEYQFDPNRGDHQPYKQQLQQLVNSIQQWAEEHKLPAEAVTKIQQFPNHFYQASVGHQPAIYFEDIKKNLEKILFSLRNPDIKLERRKHYLNVLAKQLGMCGPGLLGHIESVCQALESPVSFSHWLAEYRTNKIREFSERHIHAMRIPDGDAMHSDNAFLIHAVNKAWAPKTTLHKINEHFLTLAKVYPSTFNDFEREFLGQCNLKDIIDFMATSYIAEFNRLRESTVGLTDTKKVSGWIPFENKLTTIAKDLIIALKLSFDEEPELPFDEKNENGKDYIKFNPDLFRRMFLKHCFDAKLLVKEWKTESVFNNPSYQLVYPAEPTMANQCWIRGEFKKDHVNVPFSKLEPAEQSSYFAFSLSVYGTLDRFHLLEKPYENVKQYFPTPELLDVLIRQLETDNTLLENVAFFKALARNDLEHFKKALTFIKPDKLQPLKEAIGKIPCPPLSSISILAAISAGDLEAVKYWVERGVDVNAADESLDTALYHAVRTNQIPIVNFLLAQGASVEGLGRAASPLHAAILSEWPDHRTLLTQLAEKYPNINLISPNITEELVGQVYDRCIQSTPLILAVLREDEESVKILLEKGADPFVCVSGQYPYELARTPKLKKILLLAELNRLIEGQKPMDKRLESKSQPFGLFSSIESRELSGLMAVRDVLSKGSKVGLAELRTPTPLVQDYVEKAKIVLNPQVFGQMTQKAEDELIALRITQGIDFRVVYDKVNNKSVKYLILQPVTPDQKTHYQPPLIKLRIPEEDYDADRFYQQGAWRPYVDVLQDLQRLRKNKTFNFELVQLDNKKFEIVYQFPDFVGADIFLRSPEPLDVWDDAFMVQLTSHDDELQSLKFKDEKTSVIVDPFEKIAKALKVPLTPHLKEIVLQKPFYELLKESKQPDQMLESIRTAISKVSEDKKVIRKDVIENCSSSIAFYLKNELPFDNLPQMKMVERFLEDKYFALLLQEKLVTPQEWITLSKAFGLQSGNILYDIIKNIFHKDKIDLKYLFELNSQSLKEIKDTNDFITLLVTKFCQNPVSTRSIWKKTVEQGFINMKYMIQLHEKHKFIDFLNVFLDKEYSLHPGILFLFSRGIITEDQVKSLKTNFVANLKEDKEVLDILKDEKTDLSVFVGAAKTFICLIQKGLLSQMDLLDILKNRNIILTLKTNVPKSDTDFDLTFLEKKPAQELAALCLKSMKGRLEGFYICQDLEGIERMRQGSAHFPAGLKLIDDLQYQREGEASRRGLGI